MPAEELARGGVQKLDSCGCDKCDRKLSVGVGSGLQEFGYNGVREISADWKIVLKAAEGIDD